jgi:hypothetical protein
MLTAMDTEVTQQGLENGFCLVPRDRTWMDNGRKYRAPFVRISGVLS